MLCGRRRNRRGGVAPGVAPDGGARRAGDGDAGGCEGVGGIADVGRTHSNRQRHDPLRRTFRRAIGAETLLDHDHEIAVDGQCLVGCEEPQRFGDRLGDQHPIERITMIPERQAARCHSMLPCDWELQKSCLPKSIQQIRGFDLDPAVRYLDRNFPRRYGADKDSVGFIYELPSFSWQRTGCSPQRELSIQQQSHLCGFLRGFSESGPPPFSNSSRTSSGSGSSKLSAIQILPFKVPYLIGGCFSWGSGPSMATGVPDLAMTVPSPRAAASTSSENFAFASATLSCFMLRPS